MCEQINNDKERKSEESGGSQTQNEQNTTGSSSEALYKSIINEFIVNTSIPSVSLTAKRAECDLTDSKFGGNPYMPKNSEYPRSGDGVPLKLLAQLNFERLPKLDGFPQKGLLQFFVTQDVLVGADFDNLTNQNNFRVIYHENITDDSPFPGYPPGMTDDENFPFQGEFSLSAERVPCFMTPEDFRFDAEFMKIFKKYVQTDETSLFNLDEEISNLVYEVLLGQGHRIGGYSYFTQTDPRAYKTELQSHTVLLLQIDSSGDGEEEIIWGDCGVANFFIKPEDLARLDFSDVVYTWDCC